jgi:CheY-like chemotaxis protein
MAANEPADSQDRALRILVVEDNPDTAVSLQTLLSLQGHDAQVASDGPAALEVAAGYQPDVVLLDIGLPGMDGLEVARQLREQASRKRPLLVAITGYGQESDRRRSAEAGIDLHLVKPADPDQLQALLRRFQEIILPQEPSP